jgi:hypothetical protein
VQFRVLASRSDLTIIHEVGSRGDWATHGRRILHRQPSPAGEGATDLDPNHTPTHDRPSKSTDGDWSIYGSFPSIVPNDWVGVARLPRRLLRLDKCNLLTTAAGRLLGIRGGEVWNLGSVLEFDPKPLFSIQGDCVMNRALAEDADGNVYFGEYFMNPKRLPTRIWRLDARLKSWEVVYTFDQPRIRHVHAVHSDPHRPNRIWITMGDYVDECFLAYTDDRFGSVHFIGDGTQLWRAVGLIFKPDAVGWLTDSHIEQNFVVSMSRDQESATKHQPLDASSWYAAETVEGLYLATTTVEPGPGIHTHHARLLGSRDGLEWQTLVEFEKDRYPMRGFGLGSISLPAGQISQKGFWLSGEGLIGLDGNSIFASLEGV